MAAFIQVDPVNPQDVTSFHAQEVGLSEDEPHFRIGYLDPPPGWQTQPPVGDLTDSAGVGIVGKDGKVLRNYDMPRYLSSKISAHRIEAYFRLHPKFSYDDIEARQPSWCPPLNRHSFSNVRLRKGRKPFNARCFFRSCSYPPKVDVEFVESLSVLQIMLNTGWVVTPRGIHDPKNPGRLYPLNQFLHGERWHTPSVEIAEALAESNRLKALAVSHGKSHWRELPSQLLPREWWQRTKGAKAGNGSAARGVQLNNGLTTGGSRPTKRKSTTPELDDDGPESNIQSSKRLRVTSGLSVSDQTKAKTAKSKGKRVREYNDDEDESGDDEEGKISSRPVKRVRTRADATVGEAGVPGMEYQDCGLSRSTQGQGDTARSGRITRSGKLRDFSGAKKLGKIASSGLTRSDVTANANRVSFQGQPLPEDRASRGNLGSHIRINETSYNYGYEAGNRAALPGPPSLSDQYPSLDMNPSTGSSNPYYAPGYRASTRGETSISRQSNDEAERSGNPMESAYGYGARNGRRMSDETLGYGHTRRSHFANNTNDFPNARETSDAPSSNSMLQGAAVLDPQPWDPQLLDPQLLNPLLRNPTPSRSRQQPQGESNPRSHVPSTSTRFSGFYQADHRSLDPQPARPGSSPSAAQSNLSEAINRRSGWSIGAAPTKGINSPYAPLQGQTSNSPEHILRPTPQPLRLEDLVAQGSSTNAQSQPPPRSRDDNWFDEFVHSYDSYDGEDPPTE